MISEEQLIEVGRTIKLHGLNGEITASVSNSIFDDVKSCPYLVLEVDGIFVPFFIKNYRFKTDTSMLISFEDIDSQEKASEFCGLKLYFDRKCFSDKEAKEYDAAQEEEDSFIGYTIVDTELGELGKVVFIDDQTANIIFIVENDNKEELMIPAADDLIEEIDDEKNIITMNLPQGLINLDEAESEE
ncbi:MAG: 16S rRNA processing protein RimM [Bacteroidales bacterium]|nr:16S rRNA processing protein RimM [Bacteroidales bacterium]